MRLEGCGECRLALLAADEGTTEEVDDRLVAVVLLQLVQVEVEGGVGELGAAGHPDLVRADVDPGLVPEERDGAADLDEGGDLVPDGDQLLGLGKVGHVAVVVHAADLKSRRGTV